jgi:ATP-dependent DNA helicase RecQ
VRKREEGGRRVGEREEEGREEGERRSKLEGPKLTSTQGDTPTHDNCGNCDVCRNPPETFEATSEAQLALRCIYHTGQKFGVVHLIHVLLGNSKNNNVAKFGHDRLEEIFGKGADPRDSGVSWDMEKWASLFRQLITSGYVRVDSDYGGLKLEPTCREIMNGNAPFRLREDFLESRKKKAGEKKKGEGGRRGRKPRVVESLSGIQQALPESDEQISEILFGSEIQNPGRPKKQENNFEKKAGTESLPEMTENIYVALRTKRNEIAREEGIPAYCVFKNEVLLDLAKLRPKNFADLRGVKGISEKKLEFYGAKFLEVCRPWAREEE